LVVGRVVGRERGIETCKRERKSALRHEVLGQS
jgi:hypothetical protein